jgi:LPLT family lysophospholipid transporter-like MFS transporter
MSRTLILPSDKLFSRAMFAVLFSQFLSALADNALLFAAIALIKANNAPAWQMPMLQQCFVIAFIILAPFVGPFADSLPKGRVMWLGNAIKFIGAVAMISDVNPLLSYGLVGVGAAMYSPAKYGILSELVNKDLLVKANSMMEGSTIVAILIGAVLGGILSDWSVTNALIIISSCYLIAALAATLIPKLPVAHPMGDVSPRVLTNDFFTALKTLFRDRDARFSLLGTSIFWGTGSTLRFLLVAWVPVALMIDDNKTPANLSGMVAIGIALGAAAAARWVSLKTVNRCLPAGIAIGILIMGFAVITSLPLTVVLLIVIGACGGFYVVPLNAMLQERGHETVGSGHAIAIQNFFENGAMLLMVGVYTYLSASGFSPMTASLIFGALVFACVGSLSLSRRKSSTQQF